MLAYSDCLPVGALGAWFPLSHDRPHASPDELCVAFSRLRALGVQVRHWNAAWTRVNESRLHAFVADTAKPADCGCEAPHARLLRCPRAPSLRAVAASSAPARRPGSRW